MKQSAVIEKLTNRLEQIEADIVSLREELNTLPTQNVPTHSGAKESFLWVDKEILQEQVRQLFQQLSIQGEPVGIEQLQEMMQGSGLQRNELRKTITAAREE